jgi:hypothetical protein
MFELLQSADGILVAALLAAVAVLVLSLLRSNRPDPKLALLQQLIKRLPQ